MGNKQPSNGNPDTLLYTDRVQWTSDNTHQVKVGERKGRISNVAVQKSLKDANTLLVAAASQDGRLQVFSIEVATSNKQPVSVAKTKIQLQKTIFLKSPWVSAVDIDPTQTLIASGGRDMICSIFAAEAGASSEPMVEVQGHHGFVSCVKFVSDRFLLSGSKDATVRLYDITGKTVVSKLEGAHKDICGVDYARMYDRDVVIWCSIEKAILIKDITDEFRAYKKSVGLLEEGVDDDEKKEESGKNENIEIADQTIGLQEFQAGVNNVAFSPTHDFIAACSDDGSYCIYYHSKHYSLATNKTQVTWQLLCSHTVRGTSTNCTCVTWTDDYTLVVGTDKGKMLFATTLIPFKADVKMQEATYQGIVGAIKRLSVDMNWSGAARSICDLVLLHLTEYDVVNYPLRLDTAGDQISALASCSFGENGNYKAVVAGDFQLHCLISLRT